MKKQMTLNELSEILMNKGFNDIFNSNIESDCLDLEKMVGEWADVEGNEIVCFDIIKVDEESKHLETIIEIDENEI